MQVLLTVGCTRIKHSTLVLIQYTGAYVEGVLVDSFVVETKRGVAAIYEHYLNEWTSNYYVEFTDYKNGFKNGEVDKIWSDWYAFEEKASA